MKKWIALLLAMCMVFSLSACGESTAPDTTEDPTDSVEDGEWDVSLSELLEERNVPALLSRDEMLSVLQTEVYGKIPAVPEDLYFAIDEDIVSNFCAGKARIHKVYARCTINEQSYAFPFRIVLPTKVEGKVPFFVHIAFSSNSTSIQQPTEELVDNGFAVLFFNYEDVTTDDDDFTNGLAGVLYPDGERSDTDPGKIAMWAWAAQRVMDYAETRSDVLDLDRAIVCGHSRLGKTALLAGATDERFKYVYSNNSGCTGAALSRGKGGENVSRVNNLFPYWFCKNYAKYAGNEAGMPFDQHYLLASVAPRKLLVGSASDDDTADPISEQLSCLAASPAFENGLDCDTVAEIGDEFYDGDIGYHLREGAHYFSREDWQKLIKFVNMHEEAKK